MITEGEFQNTPKCEFEWIYTLSFLLFAWYIVIQYFWSRRIDAVWIDKNENVLRTWIRNELKQIYSYQI